MKKQNCHIWGGGGSGGGGGLRRTQVNENVKAVRPHHRADMYNKETK